MNRDSDNINQNVLLERYIELLTNNNEHISNILTYIRNSEELMRMLVRLNRSQIFPENNNVTNRTFMSRNVRNDTVNPIRRQWSRVFQQPNLNSLFEHLTPVTVAPTSQQIMNATTIDFFRNIMNPINSICPITQQPFNLGDPVLRINHCGHIFTLTSIQEWFTNNVRCPVCRHDIREITSLHDNLSNSPINIPNNSDNNNSDNNNSISETRENITNSLSNLTDNFNLNESTEINTAVSSPRIQDPINTNTIDDTDAPEPSNDSLVELERNYSSNTTEEVNTAQEEMSEENTTEVNTAEENQNTEIPSNYQRELQRNLLATIADSLNNELERELTRNNTYENSNENSNENYSNNNAVEFDSCGNLIYSFSFNRII